MFDDSFKNSEHYFAVLQLLRIFETNVRRPSQCLKDLEPWMDPRLEHFLGDTKYFDHLRYTCWDPTDNGSREETRTQKIGTWRKQVWNERIVSKQVETERQLVQRIERKQDDVRSLRDGVSYCTRDTVPPYPMLRC